MKKINILAIILLTTLSSIQLFAEESTSEVPQAVTPPQAPSVDLIITMPSVPLVTTKVPKLILLDSQGNTIEKDSMEEYYPSKRKIVFSNHVAPPRFNISRGERQAKVLAGNIQNQRVPAYLHGAFISVNEAKKKLLEAGFEILASFKVDKKGTATSIVFTNNAMKKAASKTMRGFAGALRLSVDKKNKLLVISNPIYLQKAFMQKEYNQELAQSTLAKLHTVFTGLQKSKELIKFRVLERFRFMENMPYYQDMKIVSQGTNEELLEKVKKSKKLVYTQKLENGSFIVGVELGSRTSKFIKKIGYQNSGLLPYPVLIENNKAYILAPQYYIAVMYPLLKMSEFMKIATVPGAIQKDIDRIFR